MTPKNVVSAVRRIRRNLHAASGYNRDGSHYRQIDKDLNALEKAFLPPPKPKASWLDIGPVQPNGKSLLDMALTHNTDGILLFPAVDTCWGDGGGVVCIAPEDLTVDTKLTSSNPGHAIYATGKSGMRYWFGHLDRNWPLGTKLAKGVVMGKTVNQSPGADHLHCGINGEKFLGKGKQLKYGANGNGPDYTVGAPTIRAQLTTLEL